MSGGYSFSELRLFFSQIIHLQPDAVISFDGWTDAVEAAFAKERSGLQHGMINWTQPIFQQYDAVAGTSVTRGQPPLVFTYIYLALERAGFLRPPETPARASQYARIPWYADSARLIEQNDGLDFLLPRNIESIAAYCRQAGIYYLGYLQPFAALARAHNKEEVAALEQFHASLVRSGETYWDLNSYRQQMTVYYSKYRMSYRSLAERHKHTGHVEFVDASELFANEPRRVYLDAAHYNELGNALIAERFAADLAALITRCRAEARPVPCR
jgi:hypothetical protein